ncbi:ParA family protein [Paenibacillus sp. sgz500958]|uniref:ParA family protein n=1 Tax=Paenibacillus sp. sgz500958 TaxID=3242475 RepID=UPI0036D234FF
MAVRIVLAVRESQYIGPLLDYVHHSEYRELLQITAFSRMDVFMEYMKGEEVPCAVVGDAAFIETWLVEARSAVPWALLAEEGEMTGRISKNLAGGQVIAKYQALPTLLSSILQMCEVQRPAASASATSGTLLIGVVSGSGSSGKTIVSLNMAKQLGSMGLSVFYLNLEDVDSSGLYLRATGGSAPALERLLYEIQVARDHGTEVKGEVHSYAIRHDELQCDAFKPVSNVKEMLQMNKRDTLDLLKLLSSRRSYDIVIVDTGSLGVERTEAVLQSSDVVLWILPGDDTGMNKALKWLTHYNAPYSEIAPGLMNKIRFILNGSMESAVDRPPPDGMHISSVLPHMPSWSLPNHSGLCLNSPAYQKEILLLCKGMLDPVLPQVLARVNGNE